MLTRIEDIAKNITNKLLIELNLQKHSNPILPESLANEIHCKLATVQTPRGVSLEKLVMLLLKTAIEFGFLEEVHALLKLNIASDINQPLFGKTALGVAAFHGQIEIVKYLIEVQCALVNAQDVIGNTALHQVVIGDSFPRNRRSYGQAHAEVAEYLIQHGGDIDVKNDQQETPRKLVDASAPFLIEYFYGKRFPVRESSLYYADKVRPVFTYYSVTENNFKNSIHYQAAKDYKIFCLENAIYDYIKQNKISYGFENLNKLLDNLDNLSAKEWKYFSKVINNGPDPYRSKMDAIFNQLPEIAIKGILVGSLTSAFTYYAWQDIFISASSGGLSASFTWKVLADLANFKQTENVANQYLRAHQLQQSNRFFQSQQNNSKSTHEMKDIQDELKATIGFSPH